MEVKPIKKKRGRPRIHPIKPKEPKEEKKPQRKITERRPLDITTLKPNEGIQVGDQAEAGANTRNINFLIDINTLPLIDLYDIKQLSERIGLYFTKCAEFDMKPLVSSLAAALGIDKHQLWEIRSQNFTAQHKLYKDLPKDNVRLIQNAYNFMEQMWEANMVQGKVNPVTGIFLGKNQFGYKDQVNYVVNAELDSREPTAKELATRYKAEYGEIIDADFEEKPQSDFDNQPDEVDDIFIAFNRQKES